MRKLLSLAVLFLVLPTVAAHAQTANTYFTLAKGGTTYVNVAATTLTGPTADGTYELFDCTQMALPLVAVFRVDSGITATQAGAPPVCATASKGAKPHETKARAWLLLYTGQSFARVLTDGVDAHSLAGSLLFYNASLQANSLVTVPLQPAVATTPPTGLPIIAVLEKNLCTTTQDCGTASGKLPPIWKERKHPTPPPTGYFCHSTEPTGNYPSLSNITPTGSTTLFYGAQMLTWTPNGNETFCSIRQIYFTMPDVFDDGTCPGESTTSPDVLLELRPHTVPATLTGVNKKLIYDTVWFRDGGLIFYRVDIQAEIGQDDPNALQGDYDLFVQISGLPKATSTSSMVSKAKM